MSDRDWSRILHLLPGYDPYAQAGPCVFDPEIAGIACDFFPEMLTHRIGPAAGKPFVLEPWEEAIVGNLYGWYRPDGSYRFREALLYVPRKNGKTSLGAGVSVEKLFIATEPARHCYSAAADEDQAAIVFEIGKGMVLANPILEKRATPYRRSLVIEEDWSAWKVLSSVSGTKHGLNPYFVLVDELHAHKSRDLIDALQTGTGTRANPLTLHLTTADWDRPSVCNAKHDYACKVRDSVIDDGAFLPAIYEAGIEDDWQDPKVWAAANPNLGVTVRRDYLERECVRAQEEPTYTSEFRRLHLNVRTETETVFLPLETWDATVGELSREAFMAEVAGCPCFVGIDLSSTTDLTAMAAAFQLDGATAVMVETWVPEDRIRDRERRDHAPYRAWARDGWLHTIPGPTIDQAFVRRRLLEWADEFEIRSVGIDPWASKQIQISLRADGFEVTDHRQGFASMTAPVKEFGRLVLNGKLRTPSNPLLRWAVSGCVAEGDAAGNVKLTKKRSTTRIDPVIAIVMAISGSLSEDATEFPYDSIGSLLI